MNLSQNSEGTRSGAIILDDGLKLSIDESTYHLDGRRLSRDSVNLISHAHYDHIPIKCEVDNVVCSNITADLVNLRSRIKIKPFEHENVTLLDSGHIVGSRMFYISSEKESFLYTGDFSTRRRYFTEGAKPKKCDNLILECTFGKEEFLFPKIENIIREMKDWVNDNFIKDRSVLIFAYSLGKAQEILHHFSEYEPYVAPTIWKVNKVFEKHNIKFNSREFPKNLEELDAKKPYLMIAPLESRNLKHIVYSIQHGIATCAVSGWALSPSFKYTFGLDRAFPISDHADYEELVEFVKKCSPKKVYCWHGYAEEFAYDIKKKHGFESVPLLNKQTNISSFF